MTKVPPRAWLLVSLASTALPLFVGLWTWRVSVLGLLFALALDGWLRERERKRQSPDWMLR